MGPTNAISSSFAEPLLGQLPAHPPNDADLLRSLDDYFLANEFDCDTQRLLSILGWKKALRQGHQQQANLVRLQKLGLLASYPVGFDLRLHTPPGHIRDRILEILAADSSALNLSSQKHTATAEMVQLTEVEDEHFQGAQAGPIEDDADFTDTDSEISADSDFDPTDESLAERLYALKDMIPPTTRGWVQSKVNFGVSAVQNTWYYGSRTVWVVCATALMIGVPLATCWAEDQQIEGMEREFRMREAGGELLTAGGDGKEGEQSTADMLGAHLDRAEAKPAL
ncbi:Mitochondrial import receptor subunit tom22 [Colletotrichum sp. SAR11_239]|nr:Mitochondrial import receptor subunit tom22 [Colletotrichum sp. SAR11_239]